MFFINKRNRILNRAETLFVSLLCIGMLAGCGGKDVSKATDKDGENNVQQEQSVQIQTQLEGYPSGLYDNWADNNPVYITLEGTSISVDGDGATVDEAVLTIHSSGVYVLSGTLNDGQIRVEATKENTVQLVLNGASLSSTTSAPIYSAEAGLTVLTLADGTENYISDTDEYIYPDSETDEPDAAVFVKNDLTITGGGSLNVEGSYNNGIGTKDNLVIESGVISVTSVNHGIRGRDSVTILDGTFDIRSGNDGIQSNNDSGEDKGWILLAGGSYSLETANDGIQAETSLTILDGTYTILSGGGSEVISGDPDGSYKGLKAGSDLLIEDGVFHINSADDTVHANGNVTINNGLLNLASGDDGVHADLDLLINGGTIDISTSYEGLEGQTVTINDGVIHLVASDDGINAAGGTIEGGNRPFVANENNHLNINGGRIVVTANGDGVDSNGYITMTGGTLIVNGPLSGGDAALDFDGEFQITGGVIAAAGSSDMAQAPGSDSTQASLQIYFSTTQEGGTPVHLADNDGNPLLTFTPERNYQNVVISIPELKEGETYQIYSGGSNTGSGEDGLVLAGEYSGGMLLTQVTLTGATTRISDTGEAVSGGMGMGGGGRGGQGMGEGRQPGEFGGGGRPEREGGGPGGGTPPEGGPGRPEEDGVREAPTELPANGE